MRITTLLRCYPPVWRERYEAELTDVLEQHDVTLATWVDLLRGALDARLDPVFAGGPGAMSVRLRRSEIAIFCSFIVFVVAGIGFQKLTEGVDKAGVMSAHAAVGIGYYLVIAGAVIAALAVALGALPIAVGVLRRMLTERRVDLLGLLALPVLLIVAIVAWGSVIPQSHRNIDSVAVRGLIVFVMVSAALSAAATSLAVTRSGLDESTLRLARIPAIFAAGGMVLSLAGVLFWGLSLRSAAPGFFALNGGVLRSYAYFTWLRVAIVMGLASLVALAALRNVPWKPGDDRVARVPH